MKGEKSPESFNLDELLALCSASCHFMKYSTILDWIIRWKSYPRNMLGIYTYLEVNGFPYDLHGTKAIGAKL